MKNDFTIPVNATKGACNCLKTEITDTRRYNKANTIATVLEATKQIILQEGIKGLHKLTISRLEKESGRSKKIIYTYFQSLNGLLRFFFKSNDPWINYKQQLTKHGEIYKKEAQIEDVATLLNSHLKDYIQNPLAQQIGQIELSTLTDANILKDITSSREQLAQTLSKISAPLLSQSDLDIRVIYALLLGGINYLNLHKNATRGTFCEIDIHTDQKAISNFIEKVINWIREEAHHQKNNS